MSAMRKRWENDEGDKFKAGRSEHGGQDGQRGSDVGGAGWSRATTEEVGCRVRAALLVVSGGAGRSRATTEEVGAQGADGATHGVRWRGQRGVGGRATTSRVNEADDLYARPTLGALGGLEKSTVAARGTNVGGNLHVRPPSTRARASPSSMSSITEG
ncbi:hypothetical protein GUJ93_ZPchr0003g18317 [Zizania palustris]|uniref:Uncharacterized protein n=1 Tax=Zizania palustris TaxID=103762 RepID=A0A8J5S8F4_ZIZPA|nr:hypothetical protein GUJ93_ZPchr0003g18317 [Zizania palustris]